MIGSGETQAGSGCGRVRGSARRPDGDERPGSISQVIDDRVREGAAPVAVSLSSRSVHFRAEIGRTPARDRFEAQRLPAGVRPAPLRPGQRPPWASSASRAVQPVPRNRGAAPRLPRRRGRRPPWKRMGVEDAASGSAVMWKGPLRVRRTAPTRLDGLGGTAVLQREQAFSVPGRALPCANRRRARPRAGSPRPALRCEPGGVGTGPQGWTVGR